jgi:hypothetical protein
MGDEQTRTAPSAWSAGFDARVAFTRRGINAPLLFVNDPRALLATTPSRSSRNT